MSIEEGELPIKIQQENNPDELHKVSTELERVSLLGIQDFILAKENMERSRIKGEIPDDFVLSEDDKELVRGRLAELDDSKIKEIDDYFAVFAYDRTRSVNTQIEERGASNPQWIKDFTDIVYRELRKRNLVAPF